MAPVNVNLNNPNFLKAKLALTNPRYKYITKSNTTFEIVDDFLYRNKEEIEKNTYKAYSPRKTKTQTNEVPEIQQISIDRHLIAAISAIIKVAKKERNEEIVNLFTHAIDKLEKINKTNAATHRWLNNYSGFYDTDLVDNTDDTDSDSQTVSSNTLSSNTLSSNTLSSNTLSSNNLSSNHVLNENKTRASYYPTLRGGRKTKRSKKSRKNRKSRKR